MLFVCLCVLSGYVYFWMVARQVKLMESERFTKGTQKCMLKGIQKVYRSYKKGFQELLKRHTQQGPQKVLKEASKLLMAYQLYVYFGYLFLTPSGYLFLSVPFGHLSDIVFVHLLDVCLCILCFVFRWVLLFPLLLFLAFPVFTFLS